MGTFVSISRWDIVPCPVRLRRDKDYIKEEDGEEDTGEDDTDEAESDEGTSDEEEAMKRRRVRRTAISDRFSEKTVDLSAFRHLGLYIFFPCNQICPGFDEAMSAIAIAHTFSELPLRTRALR